jgi:hypothetical protein
MSDISFSFGCSDPACTDTGRSSHIMAFGGMLMVFVVTLEILTIPVHSVYSGTVYEIVQCHNQSFLLV